MSGKIYIFVVAAITSIVFRQEGFHIIFLLFLFALFYLFWKHKTNNLLLITSTIIISYFFLHPYYFQLAPPPIETTTLQGTVSTIPKITENKISFEMVSEMDDTFQVNYYPKTESEWFDLMNLEYGMICSLNGTYQLIPEARNYDAFDYKRYLSLQNIYYSFSPTLLSLSTCDPPNKSSPYQFLQKYRQKHINYIKNYFPDESKGIVIALIFGDRGEIDKGIIEAYQRLGIIHLLAVSGLHVGLVCATIYYLLIRIGITRERAVDCLLIMLPFYAIIAGASPSVLRATAMTIVVLLSLKGRLKIHPLDGISFVCLVLLIFNPTFVYHLGFQLSFLVSFSLIISSKTILDRYSSWFGQLLAVTILAQVVSFPVIIYHFYEFSLWSIPLNLIYIPLTTFFTLPLSFLIFLSHLIFPIVGESLLVPFNYVIVHAHSLLTAVENLPLSTLVFGKPPLSVIVFYYISICYSLYEWEINNRLIRCSVAIVLIAIIHWYLPILTSEGEITMIDVGQGESIYIELPRRKAVYLIDTGGTVDFGQNDWSKRRSNSFDVGKDVLVPFLKAKGVRKINKLILTHGHFDHIGGSEALIGVMKVEKLLYGAGPIEGEYEKELLQKFQRHGTKIQIVKAGDYWQVDKHKFLILSPNGNEETLNDRSIVIYTVLGGLRWLFTGDLEELGERKLIENYRNLSVDVLKVGHHGSNTSTTKAFLDLLDPRYALIPVGKSNFYGHPHKEVITRLEERNISILRTDKHGGIRYRFKSDQGSFDTKIQ